MFDIGWSELLVIGSIALIVVGPKDLPKLLRSVGQYVAQARGLARDFQRSMEQAAREADISEMSELKDTARELRDVGRMRFDAQGGPARSPTKPPAPQTPKPAAPQPAKPEAAAPAREPAAPAPADGAPSGGA